MSNRITILEKVRSLEAHFRAGANEANQLRKMLEGDSSSSNTRKGLTDDQKASLRSRRMKTIIKKQ